MRVPIITNCEKSVILESLRNGKRFDFRSRDDFRDVNLVVGAECGTAICSIGQTKVMCAVSTQITEPSVMRPNKGVINIDVDISPMANYSNEHDRMGQKGMELTRLLELIIRDSRCIDVESLCIRSGKEVWKIRVDIRILDEDGSLLDCACLAAITALQHFKRPHVTLEPHHTLIYSEYEKSPVPLNIYHMPICTTIGLLDKGSTVIIDPTDRELACLDGSMVVACNKRREVCALHQSTNLVMSTKQIEYCVQLALKRAETLSNLVSEVIKKDQLQRSAFKKPDGFAITAPVSILKGGTRRVQNIRAAVVEVKMEMEEQNKKKDYQSSVIMNENPLSWNGVKKVEVDEEQLINEQLQSIESSVAKVEVSRIEKGANKSGIVNRKREVEEVDDLLAGLDDEEEELMTLESTVNSSVVLRPVVEDNDEDDSLLKAKKKRT